MARPVLFLLLAVLAEIARASDSRYPLYTRCDLAPYFHRRPVWTESGIPYAHLPDFPAPLANTSCPECAWDVVETFDAACLALLTGTAYRPRGSEGSRRAGVCHFYPRLTPPGDPNDAIEAYVATVVAGGRVEKFLPYFIPCSSDPAHAFKNNAIFYDFTRSTPQKDMITVAATAAGAAGAGPTQVRFVDRASSDATMTCTAFQQNGVPVGDAWDVVARDVERSIVALNASTGESLDVAIVSQRRVRPPVPIATCEHANYALAVEIAAYPPEEDTPVARDFWIQRRVVPAGAPAIMGIPRQPEVLPQQVTCGHEALYWTTKAAHRVFNPHVTAHDPCLGAVPVHYEVLWTGLPNEPIMCPDRGTVMMRWVATDGCGSTAVASQAIRIYDDVPPIVPAADDDLFVCMGHDQLDTIVPTYMRQGRGALQLGRRVCLNDLLRQYIASVARDNCALAPGIPVDQVVLDWNAIRVEQCSQPRGLQAAAATATQAQRRTVIAECTSTPARQSQNGADAGCLVADDPRRIIPVWTRVTVPFDIYDACGNRNRVPYELTLLIAPTPRACTLYGFKYVEYRHV